MSGLEVTASLFHNIFGAFYLISISPVAKFGDHGLQLVEGQTKGETMDSVNNESQD